jgi:hypothetical protein
MRRSESRIGTLIVAACFCTVVACGPAGDRGGAETAPSAHSGDGRVFSSDEDFLADYWLRPIPPQGPVPDGWSSLEASLRPADCGMCHPSQYADWRTTLHAGAYSPGLSGQSVNWEVGAFGTVRSCLVCHAPLSEQSALLPSGTEWLANPDYQAELRDEGLVCAACHVRGSRRHGPPRLDGSVDVAPPGTPHGGATRSTFFEDARFCSGCHQFGPGGAAPNGKPLENTYAEWQASRFATEGVVCQTCHMPGRRHLWRGIHDAEMVLSGVTIEWLANGGEIGLRITNSGTGHHFPTYATPEVVVSLQLLDADSQPIADGRTEHRIARRIAFRGGAWIEMSDTRLPVDSSTIVSAPITSEIKHAHGTVVVRPDAFYAGVFEGLLAGMLTDTSRVLLTEARRRAQTSQFAIFDETIAVPY